METIQFQMERSVREKNIVLHIVPCQSQKDFYDKRKSSRRAHTLPHLEWGYIFDKRKYAIEWQKETKEVQTTEEECGLCRERLTKCGRFHWLNEYVLFVQISIMLPTLRP